MKRSTSRILTSHVGSLARPPELLETYRTGAEASALEPRLKSAVAEVVREQLDAGVDLVNDGEFGHPMSQASDYSAWTTYIYGRLGGFQTQQRDPNQRAVENVFRGKDWQDFAQFYRDEGMFPGAGRAGIGRVLTHVNVGPITYIGKTLIQRDVDNLSAAILKSKVEGAFMNAIVPTARNLMGMQTGESYYKSPDDQAVAMADAMREEYLAIIAGGIDLQIDDPWLPSMYSTYFSRDSDKREYLRWAAAQVELVNYALRGIPSERVRYHVCWGSWHGPHSSDVPLSDVAQLLMQVNASLYSIEAANVRHAHEWRVWQQVKLPEGKALMPGVVTHSTNVLEHSELVADRIIQYANVVGRENVVAGTDCGLGGRIHPQLLWAKLRALSEGAALASKQLWA